MQFRLFYHKWIHLRGFEPATPPQVLPHVPMAASDIRVYSSLSLDHWMGDWGAYLIIFAEILFFNYNK